MPKDSVQRYAESLEKTISHNYHYLKGAIEDFQGMCQLVTPERNIPQDMITDIRELYKEIRNRLTEIKAIEQLLQGKYRQYYHRNPIRDKDILEFGFIVKNCYSKFAYTLLQKQAKERAKVREGEEISRKGFPCQWFRSKEHQATFIRNLRIIDELDYQSPSGLNNEERRESTSNRPRSLTIFSFKGEHNAIDELYSIMKLREHDIFERYARDEIHGLLTHLKEISPVELKKVFRRFMEAKGFLKLKCLLIEIHKPKDIEGDLLGLIKNVLEEMKEGEVRSIKIEEYGRGL